MHRVASAKIAIIVTSFQNLIQQYFLYLGILLTAEQSVGLLR